MASDEAILNTVYAMGAASMSRQENPRRLEMLINTVLPPTNKVMYFK
jgi:chemotaxis protein MotA